MRRGHVIGLRRARRSASTRVQRNTRHGFTGQRGRADRVYTGSPAGVLLTTAPPWRGHDILCSGPARCDRRTTLLRRNTQQEQKHYKKRQYYLIHISTTPKSNRIIPHIGRESNSLKETFDEMKQVFCAYAGTVSQWAFSGTYGEENSRKSFRAGRHQCVLGRPVRAESRQGEFLARQRPVSVHAAGPLPMSFVPRAFRPRTVSR